MNKIKAKDRIGKKFNLLTILDYETREYNGLRQSFAICECDCGEMVTVRMSAVLNGRTQSCGCLRSKKSRERLINQNKAKGRG